ncbi:hypothetical protein M8818_004387 [Zalaria obscura]|uniref:Uncharacterized protein n=1 Tax=Zalaria obscura TaxID=2024903 RepID=A0ACC3SFC1_9PEZI
MNMLQMRERASATFYTVPRAGWKRARDKMFTSRLSGKRGEAPVLASRHDNLGDTTVFARMANTNESKLRLTEQSIPLS